MPALDPLDDRCRYWRVGQERCTGVTDENELANIVAGIPCQQCLEDLLLQDRRRSQKLEYALCVSHDEERRRLMCQ